MTDLDEHISRVLHHHADGTAIENTLDVIVSNGNILRFSIRSQSDLEPATEPKSLSLRRT